MSRGNARGVRRDFLATPNGDIVEGYNLTDDGVAHDLSNATVNILLMDGDSSNSVLATYAQTITDAPNGAFTFKIPKTLFKSRQGQALSYELIVTENGSDLTRQHGNIEVSEAV